MEIGKKHRDLSKIKKFFYLLILVLIIGGGIYVAPRFEWNAPQVDIKLDSDRVGLAPFDIAITEKGMGLTKVDVMLIAEGTEYSIVSEQYDRPLKEKTLTVALSAEKSKLKEGPAVLRVVAIDRSYWRLLSGNKTVLDKNIVLDLTPPTVELISDDLYINLGGSGFIIYRASPDAVRSGVQIAGYFFPGSKGLFQASDTYAVFFAHPYDVPADEKAALVAKDAAGNARELPLAYTLKNVSYRKSTLVVSDLFIQRKVAPLLNSAPQEGGLKETFLKVNRDLRKENEEKIKALCQNSADRMLWSGPFHQLTNSKVEANFADQRTYIYQDEVIDHAYHLGYDLAVTKKHPVEAANSGAVIFAGDLGIYGNTVILDHGAGISTLYAHLSSIDVQAGDKVEKRQALGKTGETGLAGGDHLHFAVLIHGVPVLPLEWWDGKWIKDNIRSKLETWGQGMAGR